ncbi:PP2C family protein-serine/threonine phosphatase [Streptomyces sp. ACA25]|uniref:PP2C family protein-serine/threonine phosphatase n=1 Tax=Streptomyces sp. ACA25 TaxID=3022596 RepID=UPI0023070678|nr:PP2C family protein-serine/threonine phosphatase [Streptomyces sp. ACA25]MDB1088556.1 PP2C family protein-serine/threonine phosphatase [Streptomyces sp. ACA25]
MHGSESPDSTETPGGRPAGRRAPAKFTGRALLYGLIGLTAAIVVTGLVTDREWRLVPLLIFLPAFAAGVGTVRQTAFAAVWVTAVATGSLIANPLDDVTSNVTLITFTALLGALSIVGCVLRIRRESEITRLRSAAAALQRQILRPLPMLTDQLTVHGIYEPVEEDGMVGGDIYEVVTSAYGTRVLIADVQGKGLPAMGTAFAVLGAFREAAHREPALTSVVASLENAVVRHNEFARQSGEPERFVTALVLGFGDDGEVQAVDCGHVPPYLLADDRVEAVVLAHPSVPLGLDHLTSESRFSGWFMLPEGATLLLCTDGITEARDASGSFYPLAERLTAWGNTSPGRLASQIRSDLHHHTGGEARDDIAVLALRRNPVQAPAPAPSA